MNQNTSSAVMQQRAEPHDSLDDFPTPPWAVRALTEWLAAQGYDLALLDCREPAANRGHMVRPLREAFGHVIASDICDYGAGFPVSDYLFGPAYWLDMTDWTITNPPFKLAEQFIARALDRSRIGVAMLVRSAFLESEGRGHLFTSAPANKGKKCAPGTGGLHPNARRSQFKKGQTPHNTNYLGHERVSKDGYVEISIDETNPHTGFERRYVLKHRWLWEQANGPVPEGYALKCLGERTNTDPSNWELITRALLPRLAGGNRHDPRLAFDDAPAELKPAVLAVARVEHAARTAQRKGSAV